MYTFVQMLQLNEPIISENDTENDTETTPYYKQKNLNKEISDLMTCDNVLKKINKTLENHHTNIGLKNISLTIDIKNFSNWLDIKNKKIYNYFDFSSELKQKVKNILKIDLSYDTSIEPEIIDLSAGERPVRMSDFATKYHLQIDEKIEYLDRIVTNDNLANEDKFESTLSALTSYVNIFLDDNEITTNIHMGIDYSPLLIIKYYISSSKFGFCCKFTNYDIFILSYDESYNIYYMIIIFGSNDIVFLKINNNKCTYAIIDNKFNIHMFNNKLFGYANLENGLVVEYGIETHNEIEFETYFSTHITNDISYTISYDESEKLAVGKNIMYISLRNNHTYEKVFHISLKLANKISNFISSGGINSVTDCYQYVNIEYLEYKTNNCIIYIHRKSKKYMSSINNFNGVTDFTIFEISKLIKFTDLSIKSILMTIIKNSVNKKIFCYRDSIDIENINNFNTAGDDNIIDLQYGIGCEQYSFSIDCGNKIIYVNNFRIDSKQIQVYNNRTIRVNNDNKINIYHYNPLEPFEFGSQILTKSSVILSTINQLNDNNLIFSYNDKDCNYPDVNGDIITFCDKNNESTISYNYITKNITYANITTITRNTIYKINQYIDNKLVYYVVTTIKQIRDIMNINLYKITTLPNILFDNLHVDVLINKFLQLNLEKINVDTHMLEYNIDEPLYILKSSSVTINDNIINVTNKFKNIYYSFSFVSSYPNISDCKKKKTILKELTLNTKKQNIYLKLDDDTKRHEIIAFKNTKTKSNITVSKTEIPIENNNISIKKIINMIKKNNNMILQYSLDTLITQLNYNNSIKFCNDIIECKHITKDLEYMMIYEQVYGEHTVTENRKIEFLEDFQKKSIIIKKNNEIVYRRDNNVEILNLIDGGNVKNVPKIAWKVAKLENSKTLCILKLEIPHFARYIRPIDINILSESFKERCDMVKVLAIQEYRFDHEINIPNTTSAVNLLYGNSVHLKYELGSYVQPNGWNSDKTMRCTNGIHVYSHRNSIPLLIDDKKKIKKTAIFDAIDLISSMNIQKNVVIDGNCIICLENMTDTVDDIIELCKCHHKFHASCIERWMRQNLSCPLCRTHINSNNNSNVIKSNIDISTYRQTVTEELLEKKNKKIYTLQNENSGEHEASMLDIETSNSVYSDIEASNSVYSDIEVSNSVYSYISNVPTINTYNTPRIPIASTQNTPRIPIASTQNTQRSRITKKCMIM